VQPHGATEATNKLDIGKGGFREREEGTQHTVLMSLPELLTMVMVASSGSGAELILASFYSVFSIRGIACVPNSRSSRIFKNSQCLREEEKEQQKQRVGQSYYYYDSQTECSRPCSKNPHYLVVCCAV
jgi:hypothetical protein